MTSFASSSIRLLRRLVHASAGAQPVIPSGESISLDGITAVAKTEAMISECASLGSTFPASIGARAWHQYAVDRAQQSNELPLGIIGCADGRAAISGALGLALSGERATTFVSGPDLLAAQDVLAVASGQHAPLVIHLACRSAAAHGQAIGSGHEAYHAAADRGCFQFFATNAQEAIDFTLIARRVAERALVPGIVAMDGDQTALATQDCVLPDETLIHGFLGTAHDDTASPTPAQRMIFGERRRRVPRAFSTDRPTMIGSLHGIETFAPGLVGQRPYFQDHVAPILEEAFDEFARLTGRSYSSISAHNIDRADTVLIAQGAAVESLRAFADETNKSLHTKIGVLGVHCMRPICTGDHVRALAGKKTVVVFERVDTPLAGEGPLLRELRAALSRVTNIRASTSPRFINAIHGLGGPPLRDVDLRALLDNIRESSQSPIYVGVSFAREASNYPKQQALMDAIRRGYPGIETLGIRAPDEHHQPPTEIMEPPIARGSDVGAVESLARWWDEIASFTESGRTSDLVASPSLADGKTPAKSSMLRDVSAVRSTLPRFNPATCDGHPSLWTTCPDASLVPIVIASRTLIESGIEIAGRAGRSADALRAIVAPFAKRVNKIITSTDTMPPTIAPILRDAFEQVTGKSDMPDDRRASLNEAMEALVDTIGELPVARTPAFFDEPESRAPGTGELFSILVNPYTCKSPELLGAICGEHGIELVEQTPESLEHAQRLHRLWEQLPDTAGVTIERARKHDSVGELAGLMLSRHCLLAMAGGDGAEHGSGAKLALRHLLGLAEFHLQPRQQQLIERIDDLREKLGKQVRHLLTGALPVDDLDALARGIEQLGAHDLRLSELAGRLDSAVTDGHIDGDQLAELVETSRALADLRWKIAHGSMGMGRARSGIVLTPDSVSRWAGVFPHNPFQQPVIVDATGESATFALGLLEGQLRQVLSAIRLLRRAEIELKNPPDARHRIESLASLRFDELTHEERMLCPPIFLIGDGRSAAGNGLSAIAQLLGSKLPVRIVMLTGAGGSIDDDFCAEAMDPFPNIERFDSAFLALLSRRACVAQTSIGAPDHFACGMLEALDFDGPALLHIHAPSPERHGFAVEHLFDQARLAIRSRAFPLFTFNPEVDGVFGQCLDLSDNPNPTSRWVLDDHDRPITPIDWMIREQRFAARTRAADAQERNVIPVAEYLDLDANERAEQKPFAMVGSGDEAKRIIVDESLVAEAEDRLRFWRSLQEIAGLVTPFTEDVRERIQSEVREQHQAELDRLRTEYESRINELRAEFEAEAVARVTRGLMALSGYTDGNTNDHTGDDET